MELIEFCLNEGVSYALTERFNQDPVEQHFGIHRIKDGCNTTPTLEKFDNSIIRIGTASSQAQAHQHREMDDFFTKTS